MTRRRRNDLLSWDCPDEDVSRAESAEAQFDGAWAEDVLESALGRLKTAWQKRGKLNHWDLFREWVLELQIEGEGTQMAGLYKRHGFANPAQAYKAIFRMKERFRVILRENVRAPWPRKGQIDTEIDRLIAILPDDMEERRQ